MNEIEKAISKLKSDIGVLENYLNIRSNYKIDNSFENELIKDLHSAITALEAQQADMWIPISSGRLPENEKEVDITVERRFEDGDKRVFTCRAVYEDGTVWSEESIYNWENFDNYSYDEEKEDFKVPQGWFESVSYAEESHVIDDYVIAWKYPSAPYKEEQA
jgi:hypothetical protein